MARYRTIKPELWVDSWFQSLNDKTRLFWIFLLTSHQTEPSGLYKWSQPIAQALLKCSRPRLDALCQLVEEAEKAHFRGDWVYIPNFLHHQPSPNTRIWHSIALQIVDAPKPLLSRWLSKHYTTLTQALPNDVRLKLNLTQLNGVEWSGGETGVAQRPPAPPEKSQENRTKDDKRYEWPES